MTSGDVCVVYMLIRVGRILLTLEELWSQLGGMCRQAQDKINRLI